MENKIALSVDLVNGILNYLASKPFIEVAPLIGKIKEEADLQIPPAPAEEVPAS